MNKWPDRMKASFFRTKKEADQVSYAWDTLVGLFTKTLLEGTTVHFGEDKPTLTEAEQAVTHTALVPRYMRHPRCVGEVARAPALRANAHAGDLRRTATRHLYS
jgi:hypothetical protein